MRLTPELQAILDDALSRGSLVDGHPDIQQKTVETSVPQIVAVRSVHQPLRESYDWKTAKAPEPTGYSGEVDSEEFKARWAAILPCVKR
ncbi:MAG: hypothetical protein ACJ72H_28590 [Candidatus Sulfotelmatobacter sp.]